MSNNITISTAAKNAALDPLLDLIDVGGAGKLSIYDGAQPAGPGTAIGAQVRLAQLTFSATGFGAASSGTATAATITSDTSAVAGTAAWFRITSGAGTAIIDGTVGTSGCDLNFNTVTFSTGATIAVSSLTFTHP